MGRLICCEYHEDSETVELRYTDGTLIDNDCLAVEDEVARNMYERSELTWLLYRDSVGYADLLVPREGLQLINRWILLALCFIQIPEFFFSSSD